MIKIPPYLETRLLSIQDPTPIELVMQPAQVVFTREDPVGRIYTIYAMQMKRAPGWKQWGAPDPILEDNIPDVQRWSKDLSRGNQTSSRNAGKGSGYSFASREQADAFNQFQTYVRRGFYSKWYRDKVNSVGQKEAGRLCVLIRKVHVSKAARDFPEACGMKLAGDGSTITVGAPALFTNAISGFERLMVGNHGVYVEFSAPEGVTMGNFVKKRLQYNEYRHDGMKLYQQFAKVNYADYAPGKWYVSLYEKNLFGGSLLIPGTESEEPRCRQMG